MTHRIELDLTADDRYAVLVNALRDHADEQTHRADRERADDAEKAAGHQAAASAALQLVDDIESQIDGR